MKWVFVIPGLGLMLCSAFFDSLRGPLLPVLSHELALSYESVSWFLVVGYLGSMAFGRVLISLIERFGPRQVVMVLCLGGPVIASYCAVVSGLPTLIGLGVLVAVVSSSIGSVSNLFILKGTDHAHRSRAFGLLHAMYGLGSQLAPLVLGFFLLRAWDWRLLFWIGACGLLALAAWIFFRLPADTRTPAAACEKGVPFRLFSHQGLLLATFGIYVGAEVLGSMWMVAYLVEVRGFTVAAATPYVTGFFLCMTITRLACFFAVRSDRLERQCIVGALVLGLVFFLVGLGGVPSALPLVGLVGPFFPLVLARLSRYHPREAPSLTLRILMAGQGTLAVCHFGMGWFASTFGVAMAYHLPIAAYVLSLLGIVAYLRAEPRSGATDARGLKQGGLSVSSKSPFWLAWRNW